MSRESYELTEKPYIACINLNFDWIKSEISEVKTMWEQGFSVWDIAQAIARDPDEVTILIIDLARKGRVKPRSGGAYGRGVQGGRVAEKAN